MSGEGLLAAQGAMTLQGTVTIDDESEPGAWAAALPYLPSQQSAGVAAPAPDLFAAGRAAERADVLAALTRRAANAARVALHSPEGSDLRSLGEDRRRQLEVMIDDLRGGLHEGECLVAAALAEKDKIDGA